MKLTYQGVVYSKKNSKSIITNRRTGKPMIVASKKAKDMEKNNDNDEEKENRQ